MMADEAEPEPLWRVRQDETRLVWGVAFAVEFVLARQSGKSPRQARDGALARADEAAGSLLEERIAQDMATALGVDIL